jgi:hypothetical protein
LPYPRALNRAYTVGRDRPVARAIAEIRSPSRFMTRMVLT